MTLLEIMIVLAILALVMGLVVGPRVMKMFGESKVDIAKIDGQQVRERGVPVVGRVAPRQGVPEQLDDLNEYMNNKDTKDPWGSRLQDVCAARTCRPAPRASP